MKKEAAYPCFPLSSTIASTYAVHISNALKQQIALAPQQQCLASHAIGLGIASNVFAARCRPSSVGSATATTSPSQPFSSVSASASESLSSNASPTIGTVTQTTATSSASTTASITGTVSLSMPRSSASATPSVSDTTNASSSASATHTIEISTTATASRSTSRSCTVSASLTLPRTPSTTQTGSLKISNTASLLPSRTTTRTPTLPPTFTFTYVVSPTASVKLSATPEASTTPTSSMPVVPSRVLVASDFYKAADALLGAGAVVTGISATSSTIGRIVTARRVMVCSAVDGGGGLLGLLIGSYAQADVRQAVGAIVGNALLLIAGNALFLCAAAVFSARCGVHFVPNSLLRVTLPAVVYPLWVACVPTTAIAVVTLAAQRSELSATIDIAACIAVGCTMCGVLLVYLAALPLRLQSRWSLVLRSRLLAAPKPAAARETCAVLLCGLRRVAQAAVFRHSEWGSGHVVAPPMRSLQALLFEYAALWYPLLEVALLTFAGALAGASSVSASRGVCRASSIVILVLYSAQLVAVVAARPFTSSVAHVATVVSLSLTVLSVAFRIVYFFATERSAPADVPLWVLDASSACDLLALGVSLFRTALELPLYAVVLARFVSELLHGPSSIAGTLLSDHVTGGAALADTDMHDLLLLHDDEGSDVDHDQLPCHTLKPTDKASFTEMQLDFTDDMLREFYDETRLSFAHDVDGDGYKSM